MLENLLIWATAAAYMLCVAVATFVVLFGIMKLDHWFEDWINR